jgi:hypothetical protein
MSRWKAIQIVVGVIPLGEVEADTKEEAKQLADELRYSAPAQDPCPTCKLHRWDEGVDVKEVDSS